MTRRFTALPGVLAAAAVFAAGAVFAAPPAHAADEIRLSAVALQPLSSGAALRVRLLNDSDENFRIKQRFEAALAGRGFRIDPQAALVLTFETREDAGSYVDAGESSIIQFKAHSGAGAGSADASTMVNVFDSRRGGLLNTGDRPGTSITARSTYRLDVSVDDKSNGRRIWEGWCVTALSHEGPGPAVAAMVPALAAHVGKSASQVPVSLR